MKWTALPIPLLVFLGCSVPKRAPSSSPQRQIAPAAAPPPTASATTKAPSNSRQSTAEIAYDRSAFDALSPALRAWAPPQKPACSVTIQSEKKASYLSYPGGKTPVPRVALGFDDEHLQVLPYNDHSVLLAVGNGGQHRYVPYSTKLWLLPCDGSVPLVEAFGLKGTDLGNVLLASDSRWLYFRGLKRLDLSTLGDPQPRIEDIPLPSYAYRPDCWGGADTDSLDVIPQAWLTPDTTMAVVVATRCGFEGDALQEEATIAGIGGKQPPTLHVKSPLSTVAIDGSGTLWVGDGGRCEMPGPYDASAGGYLWKSSDRGDTWGLVSHPSPGDAVTQLATSGRTLVALTRPCREYSSHGGDLVVSKNGGKSWARFAFDASTLGAPYDTGLLFDQFEVLSWSPLRVRAWRAIYGEGPDANEGPHEETWEATFAAMPKVERLCMKSGGPWKQVKLRPRPTRRDQIAQLKNMRFEVTDDGLFRSSPAGKERVFRTRDFWRALDWQGDRHSQDTRKLSASDLPSPWTKGCRSRAELEASGDLQAFFQSRAPLSVVNVAPNDVLRVRRAASPYAEELSTLEFDTRKLRPTGSQCKMASGRWLQLELGERFGWVNARYLQATTAPQDATADFKQLSPAPAATPEALMRQLALALEVAHEPQAEGGYEAKVLGLTREKNEAVGEIQTCCALDDAVAGKQSTVRLKKEATGWVVDSARRRSLCRRGSTPDEKRCQ